jgi:phage terminase small subunit
MPETTNRLTERKKLFCAEYITDMNGTRAAIRAGYAPRAAQEQSSRLLSTAIVKDEIKRLMGERFQKCNLTADYVLSGITEVIERCKQASPVLDSEGRPVVTQDEETRELKAVYRFDASSVLKGSELLGRYLKLFDDKTERSPQSSATYTQININADPATAARIYAEMFAD